MKMDKTWPEPRPIAEARPEMGAILASAGLFWVKAQWHDDADAKNPKPFWRMDYRISIADARDYAKRFRWFLELPPPPVSPEEFCEMVLAEKRTAAKVTP